MINMPPYLCAVCGFHKRKRKGYSHAKCSRILQERDKASSDLAAAAITSARPEAKKELKL